jgi:hypothetical protein
MKDAFGGGEGWFGRLAERSSAIRQIGNLRYGAGRRFRVKAAFWRKSESKGKSKKSERIRV